VTSRRASRRHRPPPAVVGDNAIAVGTGEVFEATPRATPPPKERGRHRWVVTCAYTVTDEIVGTADDADNVKFLDHENLIHIGVGCVDCEQPLGVVEVGSYCPAGDEWPTA
jgi:hypothetical protein